MEKKSQKSIYLECYGGISGDMTVAALLDAGADEAELKRQLSTLPLKGYLMNMLEDVEGEEMVDRIAYKPFEILTVGVPVEEYLRR